MTVTAAWTDPSSSGMELPTGGTINATWMTNVMSDLYFLYGAAAAWSTWAPTVTQSSAITVTVNMANYKVIGTSAFVNAKITIDSNGSGSTNILVGNLPAAIQPKYSSANLFTLGQGTYLDGATSYLLNMEASSSSRFAGRNDAGAGYFGASPAVTVAANDVISFNLTYEVST